ncbi:MAG TPA: hypothetical protein VF472_14385 [Burkholderiaceae bacterium]
MSCCGRKRAMLYGAAPARMSSLQAASPQTRSMGAPDVLFEYTGETGVSAMGGVTRKLYWFEGRRARVAVDARDAPSLSGVPVLKRI